MKRGDTLARSATKWNKACDKRSLEIDTKKLQAVVTCGNSIGRFAKLGFFQDAPFADNLRDSHSNVRRCDVRSGITCVCSGFMVVPKAIRSSSHGGAQSEIVSLDGGLRLDVSLGFNLVSFYYSVSHPRNTLSVTDAIESFSLIHILRSVYLSQLKLSRPTFSTAHDQRGSFFLKKQCRSDPND